MQKLRIYQKIRNGAPGRTRTGNLRIRRPMLYPLSYGRFAVWLSIAYTLLTEMQNQTMWLEAHPSFASCSRPKPSSIYRDPPRTRQRTLILAAFLPWGGSDDTVTRRTGHQHTRFSPSRAAALHQIHKRARITAVSCGQSADHHNLGTGSVTRRFLRASWDSHPEPRRSIFRHHVRREATVTPPVTRLSRFDPQPRHRDAHPTLEV